MPGETAGILTLHTDGSGSNVRFRLDALYELYAKGVPLSRILSTVLEKKKDLYTFRRKELKDVYVRLYSELTDREFLGRLPHKRYGDMILICHIRRVPGELIYKPETVTFEMLREIGMSRSELFRIAMETCKEKYPAKWLPLSDVISHSCGYGSTKREAPPDPALYISDEKGITGAAAVLYDGVLDRIRRKLGEDLILIPSSVYEMIILPRFAADPEDLEKILLKNNNNRDLLRRDSILSDHLFSFDGKRRELTMLTGTMPRIPIGYSRLEAALYLGKQLKKEPMKLWGRR